jgi:hypothetical protein
LLERSAKDVVIIAVWAKDMVDVYDAGDVAAALGYNDNSQDNRRKLRNHRYEYLVYGGINADDYRILVIFDGGGPERLVPLRSLHYSVEARIPGDFARDVTPQNASRELLVEIHCNTGVTNYAWHDQLVSCMSTVSFPFWLA